MHVSLIYDILKNPVKIDSICYANGYGLEIINKNSFVECLKQYPDLVFDNIRVIDKVYEKEDIEWQILLFKKDTTAAFLFYFKKTLDNKWVLFEPNGIID